MGIDGIADKNLITIFTLINNLSMQLMEVKVINNLSTIILELLPSYYQVIIKLLSIILGLATGMYIIDIQCFNFEHIWVYRT